MTADGERVERLETEVRVLRQVSTRINSTLDLDEIYDIVLESMHDAFGFEHALILLLAESDDTLRVVAGRGYPQQLTDSVVPLGVGVIGTAARRKRMLRVGGLGERRAYADAVKRQIEEAGQTQLLQPVPDLPGLADAESQIAIPLLIGERLIGVFFVECRERVRISAHEEALIAIVANLCASAIHNAQLFRAEEQRRASLEGVVVERNKRLAVFQELRQKEARRYDFEDIVGSSPEMSELRSLLRKIVESPASTILITGENGTGKDLVARVAHYQSRRAAAPFMNITCSALAPTLLESELFGHERGAFTDAHKQKKGLLELADGGSVFLDEIGELTVPLQTRLLRFLEDKTMKRVGGTEDIRVDVRILAATNRDLPRMVEAGSFREDLYYRLRVLEVELPPLRRRAGDISELFCVFLSQFCREFNKNVGEFDPELLTELEGYSWPGNVRELRNAVERAVLLAEGPKLCRQDLRMRPRRQGDSDGLRLPAAGLDYESLERSLVRQALERSDWNKARAARLLGMPRDWLRYRMEKFELEPPLRH